MNARILKQIISVQTAVMVLTKRGCHVLDVRLGGRAPVIHIEADKAACEMGGAMYMREKVDGQVVATYVAPLVGCQVRWPAPVSPPGHSDALEMPGVMA